MFRKSAQIFAGILFTLSMLVSFADVAKAQSTTTRPSCVAFNRNWVCGVPGGNPNVPVTQCIETVQNGNVTSRGDRSFYSATALEMFLNMSPAGTTYQPCGAAPACVATTEDQTIACPAGQTGQIVQRRTVNVGGVCGTNSGYTEVSNTCRAVPTCSETTETQQLACPAGQAGQITQTRTVNVGGVCGANSAYTETGNTCRVVCTPGTETQTLACPAGQTGQITQTRNTNVGGVCGTNSAYTTTDNTCKTVCTETAETQTSACPAGQTGEIKKTRKLNVGGVCGTNSAFVETSNTCRVVCTPGTETQTLACPAGQTGQITQTRNTNVGGVCGTNSAYTTTSNTCKTVCTETAETQTSACPAGQTGEIKKTRKLNVGGVCGTNSAFVETSNTCKAIPTCVETTETKRSDCPSGQTGEITQTRTINVGSVCGVNSEFKQTGNTCKARICTTPWGAQLNNGQTVKAYHTRTVEYGQICEEETRTCVDGTLTGSFTFQTCTPNAPKTCTFNGHTYQEGDTVTAFQSPTVATTTATAGDATATTTTGVCVSQTRTCHDGSFSGTYQYASCNQTCSQSTASRTGVTPCPAGQEGTVTETRTTNVNGQCGTNTAWAVSSSTCRPVCAAGTARDANGTCVPTSCTFNGHTIQNGGTVTAYKTTNVGFGQQCQMETRTCTNGQLSGTYTATNCTVTPAAVCVFNGHTLQNGESVTAYQTATMPYGQVCASQTRTCNNGQLSGSYTATNCSVTPAAVCVFNGRTLQNGESVTAYQTSTMPYGQVCASQTRTCNNGQLSGTYTNSTCSNQQASCSINLQAGNYLNLNVLQLAQQQRCPIVEGVTVNLTILGGANIGSNSVNFPAFTTGTGWPANVTIKVVNYGRIQGTGGDGAYVEQVSGQMVPAQAGGPAISAPYPMIFDNSAGQIWGGGGGGATIGFGHCSPAGGGGAGILPGETFDPWGSCDANGNVVAANNNSGRITRNGKNTDYLATDVTPADNEYMIRSIGADANAAYYVSGPGGLPGQAGGNAHYYVRSPYGQPYGTPASTITGYYFYPTFPASVLNVTGGNAGKAIDMPQNVSYTNNAVGDRRGSDYPTVPPRAPTPRPPLEQTCAAQTETRDVACPAGQQANAGGKIVESRIFNANGVCGTTTEWTQTSNTCRAPNSCTFNGQTIADGQSVIAYQTSSAAYGGTCNYEQRTCHDGRLSGSYSSTNCTVTPAATCTFNGHVIQNGGSVLAYQAGNVSYGQQCLSEQRVCNNGQLSGSYGSTSCTVTPPATCTFNGQVIQNGGSVIAYQSGNVGYGQQCVSEQRVCNNGQLSGNYGSTSCTVTPPATCTFGNQVIQNGGSVTAYQSRNVGYGQQCVSEQRVCNNGQLSGSLTNTDCSVQQPASCTGPDGRTIPSGSSITYYMHNSMGENQACMGEIRTCNNGQLNGSYSSGTCTQTMCTYAQAGDAIAKACTTTSYNGGGVTGTSVNNSQMPGGSSSSSNSNSNSSSSSSSSSSGGSSNVIINNSNNNSNSNANSVRSN